MTQPCIWHNPRCSKSRAGLALLKDLGFDPVVRLYLKDAPDLNELRVAHKMLNAPVTTMLRPCEPAFRDAEATLDNPEAELLELMAAQPKIIERPIVFWQGRAVVGRPTEAIAGLFDAL